MQFPQYRKYRNLETYFTILSDKAFEELKVIGGKYVETKVVASQFPEQLLIQDMLNNEGNRWETLTANEFQEKLEAIKTVKIRIG